MANPALVAVAEANEVEGLEVEKALESRVALPPESLDLCAPKPLDDALRSHVPLVAVGPHRTIADD